MKTIDCVNLVSFTHRALERNPSGYIGRELRVADRWENAKEKMGAAIEALAAWSADRYQFLGGPDGEDLAALVSATCTDDGLQVADKVELDSATDDCKTLGKLLREVMAALDTNDCGRVREVIRDAQRFNVAARDAWNNHVEG